MSQGVINSNYLLIQYILLFPHKVHSFINTHAQQYLIWSTIWEAHMGGSLGSW